MCFFYVDDYWLIEMLNAEDNDWHALQPIKKRVEFGGAEKHAGAPEKHARLRTSQETTAKDRYDISYLFDWIYKLNHFFYESKSRNSIKDEAK